MTIRLSPRFRLLATLTVVAGIWLYAWFGPTAIRQWRRIGMARDHVPVLEPLLRRESIFGDVDVGGGTAGGGTLLLVGHVASPAELQRLQSLVAATNPPVEAVYAVRVN
jgi:hypothetical protein